MAAVSVEVIAWVRRAHPNAGLDVRRARPVAVIGAAPSENADVKATSGQYSAPCWRRGAPAAGTILDAIGNTPLVTVDGIWVKLEHLNPSGSIKARIANYMIERAERERLLQPGDTIVEASSGNTGNAMSLVAAVKGYRMLVAMPNGMSAERLAISRAFGAEVMTLGDFHVNDALAKVAELGAQPGHFAPRQFDSEWNVEENRTWLGPETLAQLPADVVPDAVVAGIGTGGTIVGVGQCIRERNPYLRQTPAHHRRHSRGRQRRGDH
jgi:cysteine synthase